MSRNILKTSERTKFSHPSNCQSRQGKLSSFKRTSEFSTESGLKYFILGAFSSALLLFGSSVLYSLTGLTNFNDYLIFFCYLII